MKVQVRGLWNHVYTVDVIGSIPVGPTAMFVELARVLWSGVLGYAPYSTVLTAPRKSAKSARLRGFEMLWNVQ